MSKPEQPLIDFAESFAECPCCDETRECAEDCTYRDDCERNGFSEQWEQMERARMVLRLYEQLSTKNDDGASVNGTDA